MADSIQESSPVAVVRFITFEGREVVVLREIQVRSNNDPIIKDVASKYWHDGYILFNTRSRSIAPGECLTEALEDNENVILVAPRNDQDRCLSQLNSRNKRQASREIIDQRPRKFHVVP